MAKDKNKQKAVKRLKKLLYYLPYLSDNPILRDKIIDIYNLLSPQEYAKDRNQFIHYPQRQED